MKPKPSQSDRTRAKAAANAIATLAGTKLWRARLAELGVCATGRAGRATQQTHAIELCIERLRQRPAVSEAELRIAHLLQDLAGLAASLPACGRERLAARLRQGLSGAGTLIPLFHLLRTAALHRERGYTVTHDGLQDDTPFDLLIRRDAMEAEIACDVISAEEGRLVHRGAWFNLVDRVDPELQTWLAAHPGRYLLKLTLPHGLKGTPAPEDGTSALASLHQRITAMLADRRRADHDEAAVLRLDPLLLAGAQADELGLASRLRQEFGPEAQLSVTAAGNGVFVMAARSGKENDIAAAIRRRMAALAPTRLSGTRPGILAMFIEDTDRAEWRGLRDRLELEGEARQFMTHVEARPVVAITCASRMEMFGITGPDAAPTGEVRFRNPAHPAAKAPALAQAILSSL